MNEVSIMSNAAKPILKVVNSARLHPINVKLACEFIESRLSTEVTPEKVEKLALCIEEIER
ncbi:MAG: hypothetical protein K0U23_03495 [Gammaproteobacteria bacterium]|nr:hypothetical protein [Gammaproteobacteria bacterium]